MAFAQMHLHSSVSSYFSQTSLICRRQVHPAASSTYIASFSQQKAQEEKFCVANFSPLLPMARIIGFVSPRSAPKAPVQASFEASVLTSGGGGDDGAG
eukprot:c1967_g1_i1 orf=171-464(+)